MLITDAFTATDMAIHTVVSQTAIIGGNSFSKTTCMENHRIDDIAFLSCWKRNFMELGRRIQAEFAAFFGERNIHHYYVLKTDATQVRLVLCFDATNTLPNIIVKRLQQAFVQARPKE